ncbi:MAG: cytochrome c family protein [Proteobacteria bacterium]|nr:cytochrome c family protein [Pseudomonadota bacterium]
MKKNLCIVAMMACLMLWGCSQEEKQAEAPAPETMPAVEQAMDKAKEAAEAVAEKVEKTTEAVVEKTEQKIEAVEKKATTVAEKVEEKVVPAVEKSVAAVKTTAAKLTTTVESVTIDNKNGKVVLPHKKHAEAYGCAVCHGDKKPGPQKLGKEAVHALCQGCHKEKKSGPTACNQCHQKKAKALEGC